MANSYLMSPALKSLMFFWLTSSWPIIYIVTYSVLDAAGKLALFRIRFFFWEGITSWERRRTHLKTWKYNRELEQMANKLLPNWKVQSENLLYNHNKNTGVSKKNKDVNSPGPGGGREEAPSSVFPANMLLHWTEDSSRCTCSMGC